MRTEHLFDSPESMLDAMEDFFVQSLLDDLASSAEVSCFLSGGNTPAPFYSRLAGLALPWPRIRPALVDERWVKPDDPASNEGLLRRSFADNPVILTRVLGMYADGCTAEEAQVQCNRDYEALPRPFSLCLLGMGLDGHTASLFPGAATLATALATNALCQAIEIPESDAAGTVRQRMTLSLAAILQCRRIILLLTGAEKWQVYQQALTCQDPMLIPASAVLQQTRTPVHIFHCP